jgi:RNA polymerase sigma-70 factor (ECF subfamily)
VVADHIMGDVFTKVLEYLSAGPGPSTNLRSYLYEIAYHFVVDEARHSYRLAPIEVVDCIHHDVYSTDLSLEDRMLFETVWQAIQNDLTNNQRHAIILRFIEGFSLKEIAAILGKEVGNIKMIQNRAIAILRTTLGISAISSAFGAD